MLLDLPVPCAGDGDLDLDVEPVRLINVVRSGDGFVVQAVARFPTSRPSDGSGAPARVTHVDIRLEPAAAGVIGRRDARQIASELAVVGQRLLDWCEAGTPLRLLAAPGKHLALVSPDGTVVPLPRSA